MFANGRMDHAAIEKDLGGVGNSIESRQGLFEFLIVVVSECFDPGLDFLQYVRGCHSIVTIGTAPTHVPV
jgi:hypothetical protein